ncbi:MULTISPECIES: MFS transporter [unclassified Actinomyces]|uniref:MFS transporter n=1 Tax=unclassified Actinomyces TaxID=2609248 RepID=UPI002017A7FC|nr:MULTISPECIES: MFS transporter [unclassified Actinomyces]MCL3776869.1 MFS transporter [Actinomyces sp. AC-20-1]MCL3790388.1 MFS transporter [Actinomyces sp. 187325]MCL3792806.1 MFS transporter [Actinomyces sp. 186855]MCL3795276.1 MFS transporter [Actinomyces sp. 217892]
MYALLLAIIYLAFVSLGLPDSLVGSGWPVMHEDLSVPTSFAGIVTFIIALGTIVSSLSSDRLTRRFGVGLVTAVSVAMTALALLGFSTATQFWMLLLWAVPYGLGAGAVDAALNNYVALYYNARHMNWLHSFWGVGASISPFIMSLALATDGGWPSAYSGVGWIQAVLAAFLLATLPMWRRVATAHTAADDAPEAQAVPLVRSLRIPGVPYVLLAFFAYCAMEATAMLWGATYFVNDRGFDPTLAARFGAFYILGLTAGRFLAGFVADRLGDRALIRLGFCLAVIGSLVLALPLGGVSFAGLILAGVGSAPIYPAIIHSTPDNFGRENSQAIVGIQMAAAYTGATLMPPLFGFLSSATGLWIFPVYLMGLGVLGLVMSERLSRR